MNQFLGWAFMIVAVSLAYSTKSEAAWTVLAIAKLCFIHHDIQRASRPLTPEKKL